MATLDTFYAEAAQVQVDNPTWRWGQTLFNVLCTERPDLSEQIRGTLIDPFHWDSGEGIEVFNNWLEEHWSGEAAGGDL